MKKLKINNLISQQIDTKAMQMLKGGYVAAGCCCVCGCVGPSSNSANGNANHSSGKASPGGGTLYGGCN